MVVSFLSLNVFGSDSKYDYKVSKYDIGLTSFNYKFESADNGCEELSFKEKEAIVADIKSGKFKIKLNPSHKGVYHLSNDFSTEKEYIFFADRTTCYRYNRK